MLSSRTLTILLLCFSGVLAALSCSDGWTSHGSSCYHFSHDKEAWPNAVTICQILGGYLVEINDAAEGQYLTSQAKLLASSYWIGLNDFQEEGTWVWVNSKTPLTQGSYSNWSQGQPDNAANNENCADIKSSYNYLWNDSQCYHLVKYICEKPTEDNEIVG